MLGRSSEAITHEISLNGPGETEAIGQRVYRVFFGTERKKVRERMEHSRPKSRLKMHPQDFLP